MGLIIHYEYEYEWLLSSPASWEHLTAANNCRCWKWGCWIPDLQFPSRVVFSPGMVAGLPGPHGASAAAVVVSDLKCGSGPATTPHLATGVESVSARVEKRGKHHCCGQDFREQPSWPHDGVKISPLWTGTTLCVCASRLCNEKKPCPLPVLWTAWGPWAHCSAECGGGVHSRTRVCENGNGCPGCSTVAYC